MGAVGGRRRRNNTMRKGNMYGGQNNMKNMMNTSTMGQAGGKRRRNGNMYGGQNNMKNMMSTSTMGQAGGAMAVGSKAQVWHGTARHTSGGLTKKDLMKHKGRIVSRKKHALGKKALKNLVKAGYKAKKGTFKLFKH
jgi:hypothetical protein